jgi:LmbE family N-acetylglucosaminyl deacetylase
MNALISSDRLLILAPHPDDESLATGGLIQAALARGARVRVLLLTNGDNNPWPQRLLERRWRIGAHERARWGARRKREAEAALDRLGVPRPAVRFLELPDQGITRLLMRGDAQLAEILAKEFREFAPTVFVGPSLDDAHPDHSAARVLTELLLAQLPAAALRRYEYLVHRPSIIPGGHSVSLALTHSQIATKLAAISCHRTQAAFGQARLTRFVRAEELFTERAAALSWSRSHPIAHASIQDGLLRLTIPRQRASVAGATLLLAAESPAGGTLRWSLPLSRKSFDLPFQDELAGLPVARADIRHASDRLTISAEIDDAFEFGSALVKLVQPTLFFDRAGWRRVAVHASRRISQKALESRLTVLQCA